MDLAEIGHRIRQARQRRDLTQEQLAHQLGYTAANPVSKMESGHVSGIDALVLKQIAQITNTWLPFFLGDADLIQPYGFEVHNDTSQLVQEIKGLRDRLDAFSARHVAVPLLRRGASEPLSEALQHPETFVNLPAWWLTHPGRVFLLRVIGNAMTPTLADGDTVVVQTGDNVEDGDVVMVMAGSETTVKRLRKHSDQVILAHDNPECPALAMDPQMHIHGRVIGLMRNIERPPRTPDVPASPTPT